MSNKARHRKISRLVPQSDKKEHVRSITARYWAHQRMGRAAEEMLVQMEEDEEMVDAPDPIVEPPAPVKRDRFWKQRWKTRA